VVENPLEVEMLFATLTIVFLALLPDLISHSAERNFSFT